MSIDTVPVYGITGDTWVRIEVDKRDPNKSNS